MKSVSVMVEQAPPPPLVVMSLSLKIILNPKNGTNEVRGRGEKGRSEGGEEWRWLEGIYYVYGGGG